MTCLSMQVILILARCADLLLSLPPKCKQKDFNEYAGCCAVCAAQFFCAKNRVKHYLWDSMFFLVLCTF